MLNRMLRLKVRKQVYRLHSKVPVAHAPKSLKPRLEVFQHHPTDAAGEAVCSEGWRPSLHPGEPAAGQGPLGPV